MVCPLHKLPNSEGPTRDLPKRRNRFRGKPETAVKAKPKAKSPISMGWVVLLLFVLCGGLIFEFLRVVPAIWGYFSSFITKWTS
ncbi:hypothetical protein TESG_08466 [Trichophyton tonsurans CBS 112818]|uniref:Stress-associated endoplasmic reticulum protein n=1 Tax=Trichophyton tonsurans (strain CBS 112818) TaxID=647933 RepID=F2S025_TRIT1|nr:hypothetical protein TESG_08466 [Trichophyton tonsurans CBS 112818]